MSSEAEAPVAEGLAGTIYDIQGFSVHDGPGIRTTIFLKGCPLKCPWCHSPESRRFDIQLSWQRRKCIGTGGMRPVPRGLSPRRDPPRWGLACESACRRRARGSRRR
jgi:pyruvate-formate lyase-activating enzyme